MSDQEPTCQSCGVPFANHLGLIGTCEKLQALKAAIEEHEANVAKSLDFYSFVSELNRFSESMKKMVKP